MPIVHSAGKGGSGECPALGKSDNKIKFLVQEVRSVGSDGKVSLVPGGRQARFPHQSGSVCSRASGLNLELSSLALYPSL